MDIKALLEGKKTYLVAILAGLIVGLQSADVIDANQAEKIYSLLVATGLITLRAGIARAAPVVLAVIGLGLMASPTASAEEPPTFGCGAGGCSIYVLDVGWPEPSVGVNALEFVRFRVGAGMTAGFESAQVSYLGGLCLIPGVKSIPLCPRPVEEPAAVPASE